MPDKPFGVWHRYCDPTLMLSYYQPKVTLDEGLARMLGVPGRV
jgi:nucleoside-diphosphate-sugar epimerase